jgi:hypothetical protein
MNHNLSDNSANVSTSGQAVATGAVSLLAQPLPLQKENYESDHLDPAIGQALGCLDIKLEDELTRFRANQENPPAPQAIPVDTATWEQQSTDAADSGILTAEIIQPAVPRTIVEADEDDDRPLSSGFIIIDGLTTSSTHSRDVITTVNYAPMTLYREDQPYQQENLDLNYSTGGKIAPFHDEYSSSSQELLRQIQSGYPASSETFNRTQSAPATKTNHFTPLKIGSMAAACALAGGVVYTALNPNILATLTATNVATPTVATNLIQTPNLAANEFTELNLSTLNNIKLPTAIAAAPAPTTNVNIATTTTPTAIPFNTISPQINPPATITSQPRLADSLIKSLLPPNFQSYAKPSGYRAIPSNLRR